jgi:three-Cys-motif partner protein
MPPRSTLWKLDRHTAAKHELLAAYLSAWVPIFQHGYGKEKHLVFIEGFAGPGIYEDGEPGSPQVMLKTHAAARTQPDSHLHCFFVEANPKRAKRLDEEMESWRTAQAGQPQRHIHVICGSYEDEYAGIRDQVKALGSGAVFAFLDPFGAVGNDPELAVNLIMRPRTEALVYLPVERFAALMKTPEIQGVLHGIFGDDRWRPLLELPHGERTDALVQMYRERLAGGAPGRQSKCWVETFRLRPDNGSNAYCLFFATKHPVAVEKMRAAMWKVDPIEGREFDARPGTGAQKPLPTWQPMLADELAARFGGPGGVFAFEAAWQYVLDEHPPFDKQRLREALDWLKQRGRLEKLTAADRSPTNRAGYGKTVVCRLL